ncbi:MAG: CapA family protein [Actinomycetota bacterium]
MFVLIGAAITAALTAPPGPDDLTTPDAGDPSDVAMPTAEAIELAEPVSASTGPSRIAVRNRTAPTAATTTSTTTGPPAKERIVINGVGDVNVDPNYIPALGIEGYDHAWSGLGGLFTEDDLTVINLECPISDPGVGAPVSKQFVFRCDPAALSSMVAAGVEVANQGNNHVLDHGVDAMLASIDNLRAAGIAPVGAGRDAAAAAEAARFERAGWTIAVVGFGGVVPGASWIATDDRAGMADGDTVETMVAAVEAAAATADLVVVTIHWGVELQSGPPPADVIRAEAMIDAGADAIFGHHPHRLNALDFYRDRPIFWSLGNFVWPRLSAAGSDTAVAQVVVEPDGSIGACLLDVTIVSNGRPTLDDPTIRHCDDVPDEVPADG